MRPHAVERLARPGVGIADATVRRAAALSATVLIIVVGTLRQTIEDCAQLALSLFAFPRFAGSPVRRFAGILALVGRCDELLQSKLLEVVGEVVKEVATARVIAVEVVDLHRFDGHPR